MSNICLIGFMGCGKSTIAYKLSYHLQTPFVDTDRMIEHEQGCTVSDIFAKFGEEHFRNLETRCLQKLIREKRNVIVATGGGIPLREENVTLLHDIGKVIYLYCTPETLYEHLKSDTSRPLLRCEDPKAKIRNMLMERDPIYRRAADYVVSTEGKELPQIIEEIAGMV